MSLIEEVRRLSPELEAGAAEADELRRLPDPTWKMMHEAGLYRALQPKRWGGGEVPLIEFLDACVEVSRASASAGWVNGVIGVHPWQLALFDERAQEDLWGEDPATMHSSSYAPGGKVEKVTDGFTISGRWSFSSGSDHCHGVNLGAIAGMLDLGEIEVPDFRSFLLLGGDYSIVDNWNTSGMKGTGSKDIVVEDVFVPEYRTQSHALYTMDAPLPGWEKNDGPLYKLPWAVVFNFALAASLYGAALGYLDQWTEISKDRALHFGAMMRDDPLMQMRLAEATYDVDAAIGLMRTNTIELTEAAEAGEHLPLPRRATMRWDANRGAQIVGRAVNELHHAASGRSIFLDHPLQRGYQDVQGMLGHAFLVPDAVGRTVGAFALGAAPSEMMM